MATHHRRREGRGNQAVGKSGGPARYRLARAAAAQVLLVTVLAGACENPLAPVPCGSVPDQTIPVGKSVGLRVCFTDENGDRVSLSAKSSRSGVAVVGTSGSTVTVTGRSGGTATVTVTARDPDGLLGTVSFSVWVPRIEELADGWFPAWSPDGTRIAFSSWSWRYDGGTGHGDIFVINADGSGATNLTNYPGSDRHPLWSPDGKRIAFSRYRDDNYELYVVNVDGSGATNLITLGRSIVTGNHAWSPDGTRIAFSRYRNDSYELYVVNVDGSGATNLITLGRWGFPGNHAWSPDGTRIAFVSGDDGNSDVYVMNADGSAVTNLTNSPGTELSLAWSPDGSRIAFDSSHDGNRDIYVMNADGSGATRLTKGGTHDWYRSPAWSPDGTRIAFMRGYETDWTLSMMNADGSGTANLALTAYGRSWSPDGRKIAFTCTSTTGRICLVDLSEGRRR